MLNEKKIDYVLKRFDFNFVFKVMASVEWVWSDNENTYYTPSIIDLERRARQLLNQVFKDSDKGVESIVSGGLKASYFKEREIFKLEFVLDSADSELV